MTTLRKLTLNRAMDLLRQPDARLIQTNTGSGAAYYLVPKGERVDPNVALRHE